MVGHLLAQPVHLTIAHLQYTARIAQNGACLQLSESDDLRNLPVAIFLLHIANNLTAPRFAEVDIEVGHRHSVGVKEALEQQAKFDRVKIGNGQRPRHQRPRTRAAPWTHGNILFLRPFDEVGNDQEIARKAHRA